MKQDGRIDEVLVWTFKRLANRLCVRICRLSLKNDSFNKVAAVVQTIVVNRREMLRCETLAFIGGRPRKREAIDRRQLLLAL